MKQANGYSQQGNLLAPELIIQELELGFMGGLEEEREDWQEQEETNR